MDQSPLDALAERIARIGRTGTDTAVGTAAALNRQESPRMIAMVDQAIATLDENLRRNESKTASALEAVASWMERLEKPSAVATAPARPRESSDATMAKALALLVNRLEDIDGKLNAQSESASIPLREAMGRIEQRLDGLAKLGSTAKPPEGVSRSLQELDRRLAEISKRLDQPVRQQDAHHVKADQVAQIEGKLSRILETLAEQSQASTAQAKVASRERLPSSASGMRRQTADMRRALAQGDLSGALADISARQKDLDADGTRHRLRALGARLDSVSGRGRPQTGRDAAILDELKEQIGSLARKLDQGPDMMSSSIDGLKNELNSISQSIHDLAPRKQMHSIESAIEKLSEKIAETRELGVNGRHLQPLERQLSDIRAMLESNRDSDNLLEIARDIQAMKRRMESVSDQAVDSGVLRDLQSQTAEIRKYVSQTAQKSSGLEALERRIASIADRMETASGRMPDASMLADLGDRIDRVHRVVETAPASTIDLSPLEAMVQRLSTKIDTIATAAPSRELETAIKALETRLSTFGNETTGSGIEELLRSMSAKLDATDMSGMRGEQDVARILGALESKIESIQAHPSGGHDIERLIQSVENKIDAIQTSSASVGQFDRMMQDLALHMERAQTPGASEATLDALHSQVSKLAARLEQTDEHFASLGTLERTIGDIFSRLDSVKYASIDAAGKAAQDAVQMAMAKLQPQNAPFEDDVRKLVHEFTNVKTAQDETDRRTHETLEAVHDTLEKIVERLAMLEKEMAPSETAVSPRVKPRTLPETNFDEAPALFAKPLRDKPKVLELEDDYDDFGSDVLARKTPGSNAPAPMQSQEPSTFKGDASHDDDDALDAPIFRPEPVRRTSDDVDQELHESALALKSAALSAASVSVRSDKADPDLPLEPGAGRPTAEPAAERTQKDDTPVVESADGQADRMQSARAKFIDAARRAAQAAADQSADTVAVPTDREKSLAGSGPKSKAFGRLTGASYKKPLLLGLAAIVFAAGGVSLYSARSVLFKADTKFNAADSDSIKKTSDASQGDATKLTQKIDIFGKPALSVESQPERAAAIGTGVAPVEAVKRDEPVAPVETKPAKVSEVESTAGPADPVYVGSIQSRRLPSLAQQPLPDRDGSKLGIARIGTTPAAEATAEALRVQAESGNVRAQYDLGSRYIDGRGVTANPKLAVQWLEKAAANGFAPAQYRLGSLYRDGKGLRNDPKLAYAWFKRAAEQGNARAMHNLAVVMAEGGNGTPDYAAAAEWFRKAAEYGIKDSQFNVAILYARGLGISQDLVQSYKWFSAAADLGDEDAAKKRDDVGAKLSPDKLAEAKAAAQDYKPKALDPVINDVTIPLDGKPVAAAPQPARAGSKS